MARFILDVANLLPHQIQEIQKAVLKADIVHKTIATIVCIDETNEGQFDENNSSKGNRITRQQIENFKTNYPI